MIGWTAGGGAELAIANNWSVKAEYLFADLGTEKKTFATSAAFTTTVPAAPRFRSNGLGRVSGRGAGWAQNGGLGTRVANASALPHIQRKPADPLPPVSPSSVGIVTGSPRSLRKSGGFLWDRARALTMPSWDIAVVATPFHATPHPTPFHASPRADAVVISRKR
jgi:hypothetical protein